MNGGRCADWGSGAGVTQGREGECAEAVTGNRQVNKDVHLQCGASNSVRHGGVGSLLGHGGSGHSGDPGASFGGCSGGVVTGGYSGGDDHQNKRVEVRDLNFMEGMVFLAKTVEVLSIAKGTAILAMTREIDRMTLLAMTGEFLSIERRMALQAGTGKLLSIKKGTTLLAMTRGLIPTKEGMDLLVGRGDLIRLKKVRHS